MTGRADGAAATTAVEPAPPLRRRMACFVYESMLLFGLALIPGALGALFVAQTGQHHPLKSATALRIFAWLFYGLYFVWFWTTRGQTLAMQTWRVGLTSASSGQRPSQARALARYVACSLAWLTPPAIVALVLGLPPATALVATTTWIVVYASSALAAPGRQFWHDLLCGTRLVDCRDEATARRLRPRPR